MRLCGSYKTAPNLESGNEFPRIDFLVFEFKINNPKLKRFIPSDFRNNGDRVALSVSWDTSYWSYNNDTGEGSFDADGIYISEKLADDSISLFRDALLVDLQFYACNCDDLRNLPFEITSLSFEEREYEYELNHSQYDFYNMDVISEQGNICSSYYFWSHKNTIKGGINK